MPTPLHVLLVEDNSDDAVLVVRELRRADFEPEHIRVETDLALRAALDTRVWDIVLSDFSMPLFDGLSAFGVVQQMSPNTPFLFVSGRIGEERAADAMRRGVKDYILKDNLTRLGPAVRREIQQMEMLRRARASELARKESDEKYRALVEGSLQGLLIVQGGLIAYCNPAVAAMFGYADAAELIGTMGLDLVHPDDRHVALETGNAEMRGIRPGMPPRYRGLRKDGSAMWYEARVTPTQWQGHRAMQWSLLDVTDHHKAETELRASERLLSTVFETIPHPVFVKERQGRYVMVNRAWSERYRLAAEDVIGVHTLDVPGRAESDKRRAAEEDRIVMEVEKRPVGFAGDQISPDGKKAYLQTLKAPLRDDTGEITGLVAVMVDTTEIKRAEAELRDSQALLQTVFDTIPHALIVKDKESRYLMVNKTWSDVYGIDPSAVLNRLPSDITSRVTAENLRYMEEDRQVMESGQTTRFEGTFTDRHGESHFYESIKAPLRDPHGDVMGLLALLVDVTTERNARRDAEVAHAHLSDAIESLPAAFFLYDANERMVLCNSVVREFFPDMYPKLRPGMRFEEVLRTAVPGIVEAQERVEEYIQERLQSYRQSPGRFFEQQYTNGRWLQGIDRRTADGGMVCMRFDITDLKQREAELRQAQKMEVVGQLTGGVAHDLNNVLQVVSGYMLLAQRGLKSAPTEYEHLTTALEASSRAADLTRQLLAFSRKQVLRTQPLDLNEVMAAFQGMLSRLLSSTIAVDWRPAARLKRARADRGLVEQVAMNLAVNARDAMAEGGQLTFETAMGTPDAALLREQAWAKPGEFVVLRVRDTGCGMTPDVMSRIFEPFFTTKEQGKGTGLGLSTVYGIVQQHGGLIHVESAPGAGTAFSVYWPVDLDSASDSRTQTTTAPRGTERLLLVDDNVSVLRLMRDVLSRAGYQVVASESGAEALEAFTRETDKFEGAVLDLMMPGMSGIELYQRLAELRPTLPVLFCSGWASSENDEFLQQHHLPLLPKPNRPEQLLWAVRKALDRSGDFRK